MDNKRSYYAIIPADVRYDTDVPSSAKLLYGEITALCNEKGYCWASNDYFASLYSVSKKSISRWIRVLISKGYITSQLIYKENSKEVLYRYLRITPSSVDENNIIQTYGQNCTEGMDSGQKCPDPMDKNVPVYGQKCPDPMDKNVPDNNTNINNTINNKVDKKKERKRGKKQTNYDSIVNESIQDENVKQELYEFIKMRKLIKKPMTDRALKGLISKLNELSSNPVDQAKILERSVINDWQSVYPLPSNNSVYQNNNGYQNNNYANSEVKRDGSDYAEFDL